MQAHDIDEKGIEDDHIYEIILYTRLANIYIYNIDRLNGRYWWTIHSVIAIKSVFGGGFRANSEGILS